MEIAFPDIHLAGSDTTTKPKIIMKIVTEQKHALKIVQIAKGRTHSTDVGVVTPAVASTSQDQSQRDPLSSSHTKTDDTFASEGLSTLWDMPSTSPPKQPSVTALTNIKSAKVPPFKEDSDSSESGEYYST